jgi:hypothetical protein
MPGLDVGGEYLYSDQDTVSFIKRGTFYDMHSVGHNAKRIPWKEVYCVERCTRIVQAPSYRRHRHF